MKKVFITGLLVFIMNGCAILKPTQVNKLQDTSMYRYAIVGQTQTLTSGSGAVYMGYGTGGGFGASSSKSINPADVISGILMKKGFVILSSPNHKPTLLVRYGQGDKRNVGSGYILGVAIQMLDSKTHDLVFTCSAEGLGETEADDVRQAIERCLKDF